MNDKEKVEVNENPLERTLKIDLSRNAYNVEVEARLKAIAKTAKIKGFRPGKIPMKIIDQQHGGYVRREVLDESIRKSFSDAVAKKNIRVAAPPSIEVIESTDESKLSYSAKFEVFPEVVLPDFGELQVKKFVTKVTEDDIKVMLEKVRKQSASFTSIDRKSQVGDQIEINYVGELDGKKFDGGSGEGVSLILGESNLLPEFEKNLENIRSGENKQFTVVFPSDYHAKDLAGQEASFDVEVKQVKAPTFPDFDQNFVKKMGVESGKLEDLKSMIAKNMEAGGLQRASRKTREHIFNKIVSETLIDLPRGLVMQEIDRLRGEMESQLEAKGVDKEKLQVPKEEIEVEAKSRVKLGILVSEIVRQRDLKVDGGKVRERVEEFARGYEKSEEVVKWHFEESSRLERFESIVVEEEIIDLILNESQVSEESLGFSDLMGENHL